LFFLALVADDDGGAYSYINVLGTNGVLVADFFKEKRAIKNAVNDF
jgi:hypothetical protein